MMMMMKMTMMMFDDDEEEEEKDRKTRIPFQCVVCWLLNVPATC